MAELSVKLDVPLVPQPTATSCWAAALTMVISDREQMSYSVEHVATTAGMDLADSYDWNEIRHAVQVWDLYEEGPVSALPQYWADLLSAYGPIWVVEVGAPYHAVVVIGIQGDGTPENTWVTLNNPWPPELGTVEYKIFTDFDYEFGLGAGANAMMVHNG